MPNVCIGMRCARQKLRCHEIFKLHGIFGLKRANMIKKNLSWQPANCTCLRVYVQRKMCARTPVQSNLIHMINNDNDGESGCLPSAGCWKLTQAYPSERRDIKSRHTRIDKTGPAVENFSNKIASVTSACKSPTYNDAIVIFLFSCSNVQPNKIYSTEYL